MGRAGWTIERRRWAALNEAKAQAAGLVLPHDVAAVVAAARGELAREGLLTSREALLAFPGLPPAVRDRLELARTFGDLREALRFAADAMVNCETEAEPAARA